MLAFCENDAEDKQSGAGLCENDLKNAQSAVRNARGMVESEFEDMQVASAGRCASRGVAASAGETEIENSQIGLTAECGSSHPHHSRKCHTIHVHAPSRFASAPVGVGGWCSCSCWCWWCWVLWCCDCEGHCMDGWDTARRNSICACMY